MDKTGSGTAISLPHFSHDKSPIATLRGKGQKVTAVVPVELIDLHPEMGSLLEEALDGLTKPQKTLPPKLFYDERGSRLFDRITELDEYYPTRTEISIMERHVGEMVARIGAGAVLVEYGSGSSLKTRVLLDHLESPAAYVPIDISREHLLASARRLAAAYPGLRVMPVCADYTSAFEVPEVEALLARPTVFFPGSTIGNFEPVEAADFLRRVARVVGPGGGLLIGVDLKKNAKVLEAAYDDAEGVTAAFNKNVLRRLNDELGADFDLDHFEHRALFNEVQGRIEMHLVSHADQRVHLNGTSIPFRKGETIHTENSYKYTLDQFAHLASATGFAVEEVWTDDQVFFSVQYLVHRSP